MDQPTHRTGASANLRGFAPSREKPDVEALSAIVVDCGFKLHVEAGPGLLESVYEVVLAKMLEERGLRVRRQVPVPIELMGHKFDEGFRADILVEDCLLLELKSVEKLAPVHAKQVLTYLPEEEIWQVLHFHQKDIAVFIHAQMHKHFREEVVGYDVVISKGFTELKDSAYTAKHGEPPLDYRQSPSDKSNLAKYLFGGFQKCLYPVQKFDSDSERRLACILERDAIKWLKPAKGQFQMFYRDGADQREYVPDFVAETETTIYMLEPKAKTEVDDPIVQAKKTVAETWCQNASDYNAKHGGKPWKYKVIAHDKIADNMTLQGLGHV